MKPISHVPNSLRSAGQKLRLAFSQPIEQMSRDQFVQAWSAILYLFPGLHPDSFQDTDSGWPRLLKQFAAEAWRRAESGELTDEELYPCDSQWCGLYDRMFSHTADEMERRLTLAADFGEMA